MSLRHHLPPAPATPLPHCTGAVLSFFALTTLALPPALAQEAAPSGSEQAVARRTAVALNYCRSAFYRIRQNPTEAVLEQERQKILNNLDLTAIEDEEIVKLYTSTLDEISDIHIADQERHVVKKGFGKTWQSLATTTMFGFLTDFSQFDYASAVQRGASSWWDFRGMQVNRDMELWKVEKSRLNAIQDKSSSFLEASWHLAHAHHVPDRWLVRNVDFDRLHEALAEEDLNVRLRLLERLAPFMACYPPYWYYLGRTQQQLGKFPEAEHTYENVAELGDGHFRRDEMLAAAMANVASIRDYLDMPGATDAAERALAYATDSWEVNLAAGSVLMRNGRIAQAENAVLRNLDSELESRQSEVALLAVYSRGGETSKLLARLEDPALVGRTPIPILLRCAARLKGETLPRAVASRLKSSLHVYTDQGELVVVADPAWNLRGAKFAMDESAKIRSRMHMGERTVTVRLTERDVPSQTNSEGQTNVTLQYDSDFTVTLALRPKPRQHRPGNAPRWRGLLSFAEKRERAPARPSLEISSVQTGGVLIAMNGPVRGLSTNEPAGDDSESTFADVSPSEIPDWPGIDVQPAAYRKGTDASDQHDAPQASEKRPDHPAPLVETDSSKSQLDNGVTLGTPQVFLEAMP